MSNIVIKPWGREIILTQKTDPYTGKIEELNKGCRFSLQYHDQKTETLTLISGQAQITLDSTTTNMEPFVGYTIAPMTIHRITAVTDCQIVEVSTPEIGTTFRLEDDYARTNETETVRNSPNRGYQP